MINWHIIVDVVLMIFINSQLIPGLNTYIRMLIFDIASQFTKNRHVGSERGIRLSSNELASGRELGNQYLTSSHAVTDVSEHVTESHL